ncbi:hypothetical protein DYB26_011152 [Aphanomyces astaci]|uniref:DDE-1 domain-containing protein n=2 Tax=Aphanomyces astaci TaxID=112090 RepID=A0A418EIE9_APHAT|nr:hypothetical protein DYB26_011152 [Aphanomyces astaci]
MQMVNQSQGGGGLPTSSKHVLQINPRHPIVVKLHQLRTTNEPLAAKIAAQVHTNACLSAGLVEDGRIMIGDLNVLLDELLTHSLKNYGLKLPILFIIKCEPGGLIDKSEFKIYPSGHYYAIQKKAWMDASVLTPENIDLAQSWVEFDAQITLQEMKDCFMLELGINVSKSTLHCELDKRVFIYKTVHYEPLQMNDPSFKDKRVEYVVAFCELMGQGKIPIWIDETNFNLFTCRTKARSRRGTRAVVVRGGTQKGKNLHVIGAMSSALRLEYFYGRAERMEDMEVGM